jgi:ankyrin repeat protein
MNQTTRVADAGWAAYGRLDQPDTQVATVQSGETTLKEVAKRLNLDLSSLIQANPQIQDPNSLKAGQDVRMPETPAPAQAADDGAAQQAQYAGAAATPSGDPMSATFGKMSVQPNQFSSGVGRQPAPAQNTQALAPAAPTAAQQADIDALGQAAASGDLQKVKDLIAAGVKIDGRDSQDKQTPLMHAIAVGKKDVAQYLLSQNADPSIVDGNKQSALHLAAKNGDADMVGLLRQKGALLNQADEDHRTPLMLAADKGDVKTIQALTSGKFGANVNLQDVTGNTALMNAVQSGNPEAVKALLDKSNLALQGGLKNQTALTMAAGEGNSACTKLLLDKIAGLDPKTRAGIINSQDSQGRTALMEGIRSGNKDVAHQLTNNGNVLVDLRDNDGKTALRLAAEKGSVKDLINRGADPNVPDKDGTTPLMAAAEGGHGASVELMVQGKQRPAKLDQQDANGSTALMRAAANGDLRSVQALKDAGATLDLKDKNGRTAHDLAKSASVNSSSNQEDYQKILDLLN